MITINTLSELRARISAILSEIRPVRPIYRLPSGTLRKMPASMRGKVQRILAYAGQFKSGGNPDIVARTMNKSSRAGKPRKYRVGQIITRTENGREVKYRVVRGRDGYIEYQYVRKPKASLRSARERAQRLKQERKTDKREKKLKAREARRQIFKKRQEGKTIAQRAKASNAEITPQEAKAELRKMRAQERKLRQKRNRETALEAIDRLKALDEQVLGIQKDIRDLAKRAADLRPFTANVVRATYVDENGRTYKGAIRPFGWGKDEQGNALPVLPQTIGGAQAESIVRQGVYGQRLMRAKALVQGNHSIRYVGTRTSERTGKTYHYFEDNSPRKGVYRVPTDAMKQPPQVISGNKVTGFVMRFGDPYLPREMPKGLSLVSHEVKQITAGPERAKQLQGMIADLEDTLQTIDAARRGLIARLNRNPEVIKQTFKSAPLAIGREKKGQRIKRFGYIVKGGKRVDVYNIGRTPNSYEVTDVKNDMRALRRLYFGRPVEQPKPATPATPSQTSPSASKPAKQPANTGAVRGNKALKAEFERLKAENRIPKGVGYKTWLKNISDKYRKDIEQQARQKKSSSGSTS